MGLYGTELPPFAKLPNRPAEYRPPPWSTRLSRSNPPNCPFALLKPQWASFAVGTTKFAHACRSSCSIGPRRMAVR